MGVEIVHHHANTLCIGKVDIYQVFHGIGPIIASPTVSDVDMPPGSQWFKEHEQVTGSVALVFVIVASRWPWHRWARYAGFANQLLGFLIKADGWISGVVGHFIHIQDIFHGSHKLRARFGYAPRFALPRLEVVFFKRWRTVSCETDSTTPNSTNVPAKSRILQTA